MKTALVYHFFPHYRHAVLRELLRSPDHEYLLVADDRSLDATIKNWDGSDPTRFVRAPCRRLPGGWIYQAGLITLSWRRDVEVIIYLGNPYFLSTWISAGLARLTGKRVLFWTHGWIRPEIGFKAWIRQLFYRIPHGLLLYGHAARTIGLQKGFRSDQLHVVYNSLDYEEQKRIRQSFSEAEARAVRQKLFDQPNRPLVICPARLTPECRFDLLLQAQDQLRHSGHEINVVLIGDGPERGRLERLARDRHLPVVFYGACYVEAELGRLILASHVTVSPGKVGLTALHSLAYGTPVITHDDWQAQGPEWEAIQPGHSGAFFKRNEAADLARVIRQWTDLPWPDLPAREERARLLEQRYTPAFQRQAIDRAVSGRPAEHFSCTKTAAQPA